MSTVRRSWVGDGSRRALALGAAALLMASYLSVLGHVTDVAGGTDRLTLFVAGSLLAATLLARFLPAFLAPVLAAGLLTVGLWSYVQAVPNGELLLQSFDVVRADVTALLTGLSILRIAEAGVWAVGFAPAPTFLTWYLALRRRYVASALVGGVALSFFVLTGDAGPVVVLVGAVGAAGVIGFGDLERHGGSVGQAETLVVVLAAMVVLAPLVSVVPGGAADPLESSGGGGTESIEAGLLAGDDEVSVQGSISLSPKVRFTVESSRGDYWRVASYDRYTGQGWVRTGDDRPYNGSLAGPPGDATRLTQNYTVETPLSIMPAAWKPTGLSGAPAENARVSALDGLQPGGRLDNGTTYTVESQRPNWTADELRAAEQDYPEGLRSRYTQLPESTPERVTRRTDRLTANAESPYETARTIERWLEGSKNYSLNVSRPDGTIADSYLFEMSAGYCTYYATTMATMLRTQGIPARFVTGYTPGQRVSPDERVVRGLDSHAWVEVYFPETGWVRFDPTPAGPRSAVERSNLENARAGNESNVDTNRSAGDEWTPTPEPTSADESDGATGANASESADARGVERLAEQEGAEATNDSTTTPAGGSSAGGSPADESPSLPELPSPSREQVAFALVALAGLVAGARRLGLDERCYRALWLRYWPSGSPTATVEGAFERLEYLLADEHRPRRNGETPREYLAAIGADERARRVGEIFERAHYGGTVSEADADEARALVERLRAERTPVIGRFRRSRERGPDSI
ncbi:transglutaminaseTgpA domain-containing protein [Halococcus sediminicola]|uniref:transglutaminaseTgpA domain-containing protein n=1 Tax=Halococcus sediminicola TaxID=1264579 RepID=UPI000678B1FA|nr:transglutaminaseTgpA domain-containing protein [Halococcus sediminicola]